MRPKDDVSPEAEDVFRETNDVQVWEYVQESVEKLRRLNNISRERGEEVKIPSDDVSHLLLNGRNSTIEPRSLVIELERS
ncbi:hypothetical protein JAAARDRAFT_501548 [Jaapia argillacea MUCL 33604]|uniref:Uncharacterized protein n=1 Tax=Jaapia argillacea MUCL 33604 TaxID=933084 RepID=A0A067PKU7_9AGAM|nr:hypothetical protein JAAARDRAFT_501548 [Jaapia argillacea MUCL 33604]